MDVSEAMKLKKRTEIDILVLLKKFESQTGCQVKLVRLGYQKGIEERELESIRLDVELPEG